VDVVVVDVVDVPDVVRSTITAASISSTTCDTGIGTAAGSALVHNLLFMSPTLTAACRSLRRTAAALVGAALGSAAAAGSTARFRPPRASTLSSVACRQCLKNFFARHTKYL
jgi:hypothetical protein